jgi:hypothetical protein
MPKLTLTQIKCYETTSGWGDDDVYIEIDGRPFWGPVEMGDDDTKVIDQSWDFQKSATVVVWEYDSGSQHDHIGTIVVTDKNQGKGEMSTHMNGDGSHYQIWGKVD